jgi:hypothetical protein
LQDSTTNGLSSNEVRLYGYNDITCIYVDPPPPEITDTNIIEETEDPYVEDPVTDDPSDDLPEDDYPGDVTPGDDDPGKDRPEGWDVSDDGGTVHENPHRVGCWCCDSEGSPRVLFDIANFNVRVEDTPVWYKNKVGAPLTLKMRFSNYGDAATNRTFGAKWSCQWNSSVTVLGALTNRMVFPSGSIAMFTQSVTDVYVPPSALTGVLLKTNGCIGTSSRTDGPGSMPSRRAIQRIPAIQGAGCLVEHHQRDLYQQRSIVPGGPDRARTPGGIWSSPTTAAEHAPYRFRPNPLPRGRPRSTTRSRES